MDSPLPDVDQSQAVDDEEAPALTECLSRTGQGRRTGVRLGRCNVRAAPSRAPHCQRDGVMRANPPPSGASPRAEVYSAGNSPRPRTTDGPAVTSDHQGQPFQGRSAHELRAIAASLAFHRGTPLQDILRAVGWSAESTFARHYLRHVPAAPSQTEAAVRLPSSGD